MRKWILLLTLAAFISGPLVPDAAAVSVSIRSGSAVHQHHHKKHKKKKKKHHKKHKKHRKNRG